jgi:hypothetical protein
MQRPDMKDPRAGVLLRGSLQEQCRAVPPTLIIIVRPFPLISG